MVHQRIELAVPTLMCRAGEKRLASCPLLGLPSEAATAHEAFPLRRLVRRCLGC